MAAIVAALAAAPPAPAVTTVWAAGDGGVPESYDDEVAARIRQLGVDRFLYLGDVYQSGTWQDYSRNYAPSFGRFRSISSPTPGNHEWLNHASGYDPYWGVRAPRSGGHWYSFDLGGWHFVSLNSEQSTGADSRQIRWLRGDLRRHPGTCTIAFWHRPRYSATRGDDRRLDPAWRALDGHSVAVLNGHEHNYQRFRRRRGIVEFIVGTGGRHQYELHPDSRLRASRTGVYGALRLRLARTRARFDFVSSGGTTLDSGTLRCNR